MTSKDDFKVYRDDNLRQTGFSGTITMFKNKIYVNTVTGEGIETVLSTLNPLKEKYSNKVKLSGYDPDDIGQEFDIMVICGMKSYNASKSSLSTFLLEHIHNRMKTLMSKDNKKKKDATFLNHNNEYPCPICDGTVSEIDCELACNRCEKIFDKSSVPKYINTSRPVLWCDNDEEFDGHYNYEQSNFMFQKSSSTKEFMIDLKNGLEHLDEKTRNVLSMYIFEDKTLEDIGRHYNVTRECIRLILLRIKNNKKFIKAIR